MTYFANQPRLVIDDADHAHQVIFNIVRDEARTLLFQHASVYPERYRLRVSRHVNDEVRIIVHAVDECLNDHVRHFVPILSILLRDVPVQSPTRVVLKLTDRKLTDISD
jgi:hypothetical protein